MGRPDFRRGLLALVAILALAACSETASPPLDATTWQPGTGSVSGYVTNRKAGTDVQGTVVTLSGTDVSTTTDENGFYRLFNIPAGFATLTFTQDGYAASTVEGLRVGDRAETKYDTIQAEAFDPYLPAESPELTVSLENGASVGDTLAFTLSGSVAAGDANRFYGLATVGLGQSRGTSGYLNASVPGALFGFDGSETLVEDVPTAGFEGDTSVHIVAYDGNFNRTEVVRYVNVAGADASGELGDVTDVGAFAVTFGDTAVFGPLSTGGRGAAFSGRELMKAVRAGDLSALKKFAPQAQLEPQGYLDEALIWADVYFNYEGETLPTAFRVYRHLVGRPTGGSVAIGQLSPAQAQIDPEDPAAGFYFRDTTGGLEVGVEAVYQVEAVYGDDTTVSETSSVTPLPILEVDALTPENDAVNVTVKPDYEITVDNRSSLLYIGAVVLDRVHAEGSPVEWAFLAGETDGATELAIPHNLDGTAVNDELQPFHGYDWQPIAATSNGTVDEGGSVVGENAISVGADFFDLLGLGFGVSDGPVNTFSTGDGSF